MILLIPVVSYDIHKESISDKKTYSIQMKEAFEANTKHNIFYL
jgi:hypothetical protein